jgi:hypothetical protein
MPPYEYVGNLHIHTPYSDGAAYHADIADMALTVGLDFLIFTDHNIWLSGIEGYFGDQERGHILLLVGQEVHDRTRNPQCNHLLVYGAEQEVSPYAHDLAALVKKVNGLGGMSFIAHPDDHAVAWFGEPAIPWLDRYVQGFTGLEIWNYMSRFKDYIQTRREAVRNVFRPDEVMIGPNSRTLTLWDQLLEMGQHIVGIGGADAHGTQVHLGPVNHTVFPYDFLFNSVNTHILTRMPLAGDTQHDKRQLYQALRQGRAFIGYDIPGNARGFRFTAQGQNTAAIMGETIRLGHGVTLQTLVPQRAHLKLIRHGEIVAEERYAENLTYVAREPGAYRSEAWLPYQGLERAWILSNPIYVEANPSHIH